MPIPVSRTLHDLRARVAQWRAKGERIALAPTMGALHAGHLELIRSARSATADRVVVTIFVNPKQFAPTEDFAAYPRNLEADCRLIEAAEADLVYAPDPSAMYPSKFATIVKVDGPALAGLEDRFRPTHFAGVATVVAKLLIQAQADHAFFGEKDFQQLRVIQRMSADLDLPTAIHGVPIVRDLDGLALSSRNVYLDQSERARAPALAAALHIAAGEIARGRPVAMALGAAGEMLLAADFVVDYVEARRSSDLAILEATQSGDIRVLAAARLGRTRLIDNVGLPV